MVPLERNLVDAIWPVTERPPYSQDPIYVHELQFAGNSPAFLFQPVNDPNLTS